MKLALNGATIMPSPIEQDVDIAAQCGYQALELWAAKLDTYVSHSSLAQLRDRMAAAGLQPSCINSIEDITANDAAGRDAILTTLRARVSMARELGAPSIVVVPSCRAEILSYRDAIADAVEVLRVMSDVAGDVSLAFEFLGKPGCTVPTLGMAMEIVDQVDRPNVGMVLDVFHFYAGGSDLDDVRRIAVDKLFMVHLNGVEDLPKDQLTDAHRLYPGEGATPIAAILDLLHQRGYDDIASVEIFRPEYWQQDRRAVASRAYELASQLLARHWAMPAPTARD